MADPFLAIAEIANDVHMNARMNAAATQQAAYETQFVQPEAPLSWVAGNRWVWAASPGWGAKWRFAEDSHPDDPEYQPGRDESVITDGDILSAVQTLMGAEARWQAENMAPENERVDATADAVQSENTAAGST